MGRDYCVRLDASDDSVDPQAIGPLVDVTADLGRLRVRRNGRLVADHARVWARGSTAPTHVETAKQITYLAGALKPPRIAGAARPMANQARQAD